MINKTINIALIGFGNVAQAFVKMAQQKNDFLKEEFGVELKYVAISTGRSGSIIDEKGIDMENFSRSSLDPQLTSLDVIKKAPYDIMIELTPISIFDGEPAITHIKEAFIRGKHVITANKGPVAWAYRELCAMAREKGVSFCHEATVMDGVPIYNLKNYTLRGNKITEVKGVFNATTNFILSQMENGISFEDAVEDGRRRGFVEADASMDIDGWDAAAKLTALINVLMDEKITPLDIDRVGISHITQKDIEEAKKSNKKIKLICHGKKEGDKLIASVKPTQVDADSRYGSLNGIACALTITTDLLGPITVVEEIHVPEINQTAYGIFSDLISTLSFMDNK